MEHRKIKFRIWDKEHNKLLKLHQFGNQNIEYLNEREDLVVLQFTGVKDRNGKEIYEGDVLQWEKNDGWNEKDSVEQVSCVVKYEGSSFNIPEEEVEIIGVY